MTDPRLICGDCLEVLPTLEENSVDLIATDPPYGISFMGKQWDKALPDPAIWRDALRVAKPGAFAFVMCTPRSDCLWRMCRDLEEAGWDLTHAQMYWIYRCVSEDTEVLTETGWERYSKAIVSKSVLCYNVDTETFEFHKPLRSFVYENQHPAYRVHSDHTDQIVSRNHRCLVEREGGMVFEAAESLASGPEVSVPILESLHDLPDRIPHLDGGYKEKHDLLEAVLHQGADGPQAGPQAAGGAGLPGADYLRGLREESLEAESLAEKGSKPDLLIPVQRDTTGAGAQAAPVAGAVLLDRLQPEELSGKDDRGRESGLEGRGDLLQAEGELREPGDQVRALPGGVPADGPEGRVCYGAPPAGRAGDGAVLAEDGSGSPREPRRDGQPVGEPASLREQPGPQALRGAGRARTTLATVEEVEYRGRMWCLEVPTGAFVARRNGQIFITGNSGFPKALDIGKDFDRAAFVEWVKAGPAEAMGWGPEEIRKAASAAVNGLWEKPGGPRSPETKGGSWAEGTTLGHQPDRDDAKALLSSLLARFPDAPGVRVKTGTRPPGWGGLDDNANLNDDAWAGIGEKPAEGLPLTAPATDLAQQWDGWQSPGLKPACECIIVCRKPFSGPVRENVRKWGVGGFNVEAARIPFAGNIPAPAQHQHMESGAGGMMTSAREDVTSDRNGTWWEPETGGRFPANLLCSDLALGEVGSRYFDVDKWSEEHGIDEDGWAEAAAAGLVQVAKPSKGEKEEGLLDLKAQAKWPQQIMWNGENGDAAWRKKNPNLPARNHHPTCKPVRLMSYLIHLACPPGGLVLDPFMGSGTTGVAAVKGGWDFLGFELEPDYCEIARRRIKAAQPQQLPIAAT